MDGTYSGDFKIELAGDFQIAIEVEGKHIFGSPFDLRVYPDVPSCKTSRIRWRNENNFVDTDSGESFVNFEPAVNDQNTLTDIKPTVGHKKSCKVGDSIYFDLVLSDVFSNICFKIEVENNDDCYDDYKTTDIQTKCDIRNSEVDVVYKYSSFPGDTLNAIVPAPSSNPTTIQLPSGPLLPLVSKFAIDPIVSPGMYEVTVNMNGKPLESGKVVLDVVGCPPISPRLSDISIPAEGVAGEPFVIGVCLRSETGADITEDVVAYVNKQKQDRRKESDFDFDFRVYVSTLIRPLSHSLSARALVRSSKLS